MMGVVDLGFVLYAHIQVAAATGEGARVGSLVLLDPDGGDSDNYRLEQVAAAATRAMGELTVDDTDYFDPDTDVTIVYHIDPPTVNETRTTDPMTVEVHYRQPIVFNVLPGLIGDSFEVGSKTKIRIQ